MSEYRKDCLGVIAEQRMKNMLDDVSLRVNANLAIESIEGYNSSAEIIFYLNDRRYKVTFEEIDPKEDYGGEDC